jgi:hypothetical protein
MGKLFKGQKLDWVAYKINRTFVSKGQAAMGQTTRKSSHISFVYMHGKNAHDL